jgi:hypothetical protein
MTILANSEIKIDWKVVAAENGISNAGNTYVLLSTIPLTLCLRRCGIDKLSIIKAGRNPLHNGMS